MITYISFFFSVSMITHIFFIFRFCPLAVRVSALLLYALKKKKKVQYCCSKLFGSPLQISSNLLFIMGRHMFISSAFFVSPCLILFCIICVMCKIAKQIN